MRLNEKLPNETSPWLNRTGRCGRMENITTAKSKALRLSLVRHASERSLQLNGIDHRGRIEVSLTRPHYGRIKEATVAGLKTFSGLNRTLSDWALSRPNRRGRHGRMEDMAAAESKTL